MLKFYCNEEINCIGLMLEAMMLGNNFEPSIIELDNGEELTIIAETTVSNPTINDVMFHVENASCEMSGDFNSIVLQLYGYEKFVTANNTERTMVA